MSPLATQIGMRLRQLRQAAQLTQEELAARAGLSTSMVSMTERGERLPTLETLVALLNGVGTEASGDIHALAEFFDTTSGLVGLTIPRVS